MARPAYSLTTYFTAILSDLPMWLATALSTDFEQTGFSPGEELLVISRTYVIYPIPYLTALDGVSRLALRPVRESGLVNLSRCTSIDAGDDARKPPRPLLALALVSGMCLFYFVILF